MDQFSGCTISPQKCNCFEKLTPEETRELNEHCVTVQYSKGEVICKQGSFANNVMYMEHGLAKVVMQNGSNTLVLRIIPDGNLFGLSPLNEENNVYQYSTVAYVDCEVKLINIQHFRQLIRQNAAFAKEVINILSANSLQIYGRFFCLTHKQSYGRLADILLCLSDRVFKSPEFDLPSPAKTSPSSRA
ncbi:MAG TPA: cyclic nucleotide-binding domain-containing protein [Bacteroidales bacterium]|nr:cyclic nucleotide-binding domain-containing protein [Bacteroidales bacterium]